MSATSSTSSPARRPGTNIAYWGPEIKIGVPQPALNVNMDAHTNVESLSASASTTSRRQSCRSCSIQEPITKVPIPIPVPDITPLNPPLGLIAADPEADRVPSRGRPS